MQTFLPYESYWSSAESLDYKRLGKQRVEAKQILNALDGLSKGWVNHPVTKMWRGYEYSLAKYGLIVCKVWTDMGYKDSLTPFFRERMAREVLAGNTTSAPYWLGDRAIHISHQSNLIRKLPTYYEPIFGSHIRADLPYIYPTAKQENQSVKLDN